MSQSTTTVTVTIQLDQHDHDVLKMLAIRTDRPIEQVITELVTVFGLPVLVTDHTVSTSCNHDFLKEIDHNLSEFKQFVQQLNRNAAK